MKNNQVTRSQSLKVTKIVCLCVMATLCLLFFTASAWAATTNQISQFGITWTFDKQYEYGQFANGDYWVVGPVTIVDINPRSIVSSGRTINGSMVNPLSTYRQGFDSNIVAYDVSYNAGRPSNSDLSVNNPLIVTAGKSVVSTKSLATPIQSVLLENAAVLTVLSSAPPPDSFRPPYVGTDKTIRFNKLNLNYNLLSSLAPVPGTPTLHKDTLSDPTNQQETVERRFERPWLDFVPSASGTAIHPTQCMQPYSREAADDVGIGSLMLNLDYSNSEKEILLVRMVQLGIDEYGVVTNGGLNAFENDGGVFSGHKWPILFAGIMLNDSNMKAIGQKSGDYLYSGSYGAGNPPPDYIHFGEDDQTFYVKAADIYSSPYALNWYHLYTQTGHVKVTHGSKTVVGVGTTWSGLPSGLYFGVAGDNRAAAGNIGGYLIASIDSNTQLTLTMNYEGDTNQTGNATYAISDYVFYGHGNPAQNMDFNEYVASDLGLPEWGIRHSTAPYGDGNQWDTPYRDCCTATSWDGFVLSALIMNAKTLWNHDALFDYQDRFMANEVNYRSWSVFTGDMWDAYRVNYGPIWPATATVIYGDVDGNGEVSAYDAALTAQAAVGLITLTVEQTQAADVSGEGEVSAYDAALIAQRAVGLITKFPVEG